jgi:homoserine O-acetyltransferase
MGIPSDRLFTLYGQEIIAREVPGNIDGDKPSVLDAEFGHDSFLIEYERVGQDLTRLLSSEA